MEIKGERLNRKNNWWDKIPREGIQSRTEVASQALEGKKNKFSSKVEGKDMTIGERWREI